MVITEQQLIQVLPKASGVAGSYVPELNAAMARYAIDSPERIAAFIAQVGYESAQFTQLLEGLNYSAIRLAALWPNRFSDKTGAPNALALQIGGHPQEIANVVYADRLGNGLATSGDGWLYRGRGLIQMTGRSNYRAAGEALGVDLEATPELLEQPRYACLSAAWFWTVHALNDLADTGDFQQITRRINGGLNGYADRERLWKVARTVWV